jgi:hypothetical protein
MTKVLAATQTMVATPYLANVLLPVLNVPANRSVTPDPCTMALDVV